MRIFFPLIFATVFILFFGFLQVLLLRALNKPWWRNKIVRRLSWSLPAVGTIMVIGWGIGEYYTKNYIAFPCAILAVTVFILEISLMLSLPFSGIMHFIHNLTEKYISRKNENKNEKMDSHRRAFLKTAALAFPVTAISSGVAGISNSFDEVKIVRKEFVFDNIPDDLNGFKILQLSDLHLRHYVTIDDLESVLFRAKELHPDLVLITGDVADNLKMLPEAIKLIEDFNPPLGIYASLGNHEYYRGITEVLAAFHKSNIPLMVNRGEQISVGKNKIFIGGIDDPVTVGGNHSGFFRRTIDQTMSFNSENDFSVVMSHRPGALDYTAKKGVSLILSGHTHGGQIGFMGKSIFELLLPEKYLWGRYERGNSQMYTTCGMGHWFPFRLACPREAPLIVLKKA